MLAYFMKSTSIKCIDGNLCLRFYRFLAAQANVLLRIYFYFALVFIAQSHSSYPLKCVMHVFHFGKSQTSSLLMRPT